MPSGLHHVTLITRRLQANVDFYLGFLGLRLVKRTSGFEDAAQLHLFYGDMLGSPGSLVTFLAWEDGAPGRVGHGQVAEIAVAVPPEAIGGWLTRALAAGLRPEGPVAEFGEPVLRLRDPDGIIVKITGAALPPASQPAASAQVPPGEAILRLRSVTLFSEKPAESAAFLATQFGLTPQATAAGLTRLVGPEGDAVDIRDASGFWPGRPGTGTADHVALRTPDTASLAAAAARLRDAAEPTTLHDRHYFRSLYVRDPAGVLLELATDGPGFLVDEPAATLGTRLMLPPALTGAAREDTRLSLPQLSLPGDWRMPHRDLGFVHRLVLPEGPDGPVAPTTRDTLVLLHGSGGEEADLIPLARRAAAGAAILALRGRSLEEGRPRWFRRVTPDARRPEDFDQADIRFEAEALAAFLEEAQAAYGLEAAEMVLLGYSNGANLAAALLQLVPGRVRRAILLRPQPVLADPPAAELAGTAVLAVLGAQDPAAADGVRLAEALARGGATVTQRLIPARHALVPGDTSAAADWLAATPAPGA